MQLAAALGADITDDLTEDGAEYTVYKRQLEGIDQRIDKVSILEDTRLTFHYRCDRIADPVVQRQVGQRVVALPEHKGLEDQQCDRHDDAENKEQEQHGRDQHLMLAQTDRGGTAALAADGGVGLARADQLLVDEYRDRSDADHDECHGKRGLGVLGLAVHVQLAGQGHEVDLGAQVVDNAEGADRLGEGQDNGGKHSRQYQREGDLAENGRLAGALDLAHLLQLGVDGVQCCGNQQIRICVIMKRKHGDDRDRAVCQPVGNIDAKTHQEAWRTADAFGLEHGQPSLRFTPARDHIRNDNCQREERLEGKIRADHQPCKNRSDQDGEERYADTDQQRIEQRLEQHLLGQCTAEQALPVIQCERSRCAACQSCILLGQRKRGRNHIQQRKNDQVGQQHDRDQHDQVIRVGDNRLDLVL